MQKAIDQIFVSLMEDLKYNIDYFKQSELENAAVNPRSSAGSQDITFHLDNSGYYYQKFTKYGAGVAVRFKVTILSPAATYNISIKSSDGGGGTFKNVGINQSRAGTIRTSFWHVTTIVITIQSTIKNIDVIAKLDYSY